MNNCCHDFISPSIKNKGRKKVRYDSIGRGGSIGEDCHFLMTFVIMETLLDFQCVVKPFLHEEIKELKIPVVPPR
jgi:hypothetical protein